MEVGKRVKKLLGQQMDLESIANIVNANRQEKLTPKQCLDEYYKYMGMTNPSAKASSDLEDLIKKNAKIHLFGPIGSGKSYLVRQTINLLGLNKIISFARKEEDLVQDFGNLPFEEDSNSVFVLEGDAYYWRKYGLIRNYIQKSKHPFIVITRDKATPTKNITKHLTQVKKFPPTQKEVADYFSVLDGTRYLRQDTFIREIYDKDWRKIWRNYKYGRNKDEYESQKEAEEISSKQFVYLLLKGKAKYSDFERCEHPLSFTLNWLGYNASRFYTNYSTYSKAMQILGFLDRNKYNMKQPYLVHHLLEDFPKAEAKGYLSFPPYQKIKEEKEDDYAIEQGVRESIQEEPQELEEELGDFLLL